MPAAKLLNTKTCTVWLKPPSASLERCFLHLMLPGWGKKPTASVRTVHALDTLYSNLCLQADCSGQLTPPETDWKIASTQDLHVTFCCDLHPLPITNKPTHRNCSGSWHTYIVLFHHCSSHLVRVKTATSFILNLIFFSFSFLHICKCIFTIYFIWYIFLYYFALFVSTDLGRKLLTISSYMCLVIIKEYCCLFYSIWSFTMHKTIATDLLKFVSFGKNGTGNP